ncbi:MFS general substrate transporter [Cryphonectria parasitica EP155]|uniref:MFS general substrate transporter n=1 Tax=Cryphonectria parasitica (strain ATCC 38755 / EP155) TaxID=660469 RepID=A0A9P5CRS7_CRYP1|nr:MFS general substrate transporter [Cryphonectria parasitica EP155]KAF3767586.1 MFS general substrate transporter [Cryphonectria parasitica EP155]
MQDRQLQRARIISSVAATMISLACGSNYVYSAWAPQFAERLKYSTTESNLVGLAGNLGMYACGLPIGLFVDKKGPRPAVLIGSILLGLGYFPLYQAYNSGSGPVFLMCLYSFLSGLGGCTAFAAAIKTSALNWPHHRGTATAFPLAAFGLSAFFFSLIGGFLFPGDTSDFLLLLSCGTSGMTFLGFWFLRIIPHGNYQSVATSEEDKPEEPQPRRGGLFEPADQESGIRVFSARKPFDPTSGRTAGGSTSNPTTAASSTIVAETDDDEDETSSLVSKVSSVAGEVYVQNVDMDRSHLVDVRGWDLLRNLEFWQLFVIMGILAGIGLMTINNIGHSVQALWQHFDDSISNDSLLKLQNLHVSILSVCSFSGRLMSGVGSDFLVKVLHASRIWCLFVAGSIFFVAQICAMNIINPHMLGFVSGLSGLGYGFLFGVFPSIVAESFGIHGLSQNWGLMTMSPVLSGNIFNLFYGVVFDQHSVVGPNGERSCIEGLECYRSAYLVTVAACALGFALTLWVIRHQWVQRQRDAKSKDGHLED